MADEKQTIWTLFECGGGSRWSSAHGAFFDNSEGEVCNFSGCNCGTKTNRVKETTDRSEAHDWFRGAYDYNGGD